MRCPDPSPVLVYPPWGVFGYGLLTMMLVAKRLELTSIKQIHVPFVVYFVVHISGWNVRSIL